MSKDRRLVVYLYSAHTACSYCDKPTEQTGLSLYIKYTHYHIKIAKIACACL